MKMAHDESFDVESLITEITTRLRALGDLKAATIRAVRRQSSERIKNAPPQTVVQLAVRLLNQSTLAPRFVAYELVHYHHEALTSLRAKELERLGCGINDWAAVDTFACYLSGPAWREGQVPDKLIHRWARSNDRWWRRAALVSTVALNNKARGGRGDAERTLEVCRMLVNDRDDMVVKAMSWALRELAKREPKAVRRFLAEHEDALAARVLREVRNKLTTGLKNPRQKSA